MPAPEHASLLLRLLSCLPRSALRRSPERRTLAARLIWRAITRLPTNERFALVHARNLWGSGESVSGTGSTLSETATLRAQLPGLLAQLQVRTLLDIPCGDFNWMRHVDLGTIRYIGIDVVPGLVGENVLRHARPGREFRLGDLLRDELPRADAALVRDCLVHLSFAECRLALDNLKASGTRYLLATTFPAVEANEDIPAVLWRPLNMQRNPFFLPPPLALVHEGHPDSRYASKSLGVWDLQAHWRSPEAAQ